MKTLFAFLLTLAAMAFVSTAAAETPDTVWTKRFGTDVRDIQFSPDGSLLLIRGGYSDYSTLVLRAIDGEVLYSKDNTSDAIFTNDGNNLLVLDRYAEEYPGTTALWSVEAGTWKEIEKMRITAELQSSSWYGVFRIRLSADGKKLAHIAHHLWMYDMETGQKDTTFKWQWTGQDNNVSVSNGFFTPDGKTFVFHGQFGSVNDRRIGYLNINLNTLEFSHPDASYGGNVGMTYIPTRRYYGVESRNGNNKLAQAWDAESKQAIISVNDRTIDDIHVSSDGRLVAITPGVEIWNREGKRIYVYKGTGSVSLARFSPNGKYLAASGYLLALFSTKNLETNNVEDNILPPYLYPNPGSGTVTIPLPASSGSIVVNLTASDGSTVLQQTLEVLTDKTITLNLSGIETGTYTVCVSAGKAISFFRLIIQR